MLYFHQFTPFIRLCIQITLALEVVPGEIHNVVFRSRGSQNLLYFSHFLLKLPYFALKIRDAVLLFPVHLHFLALLLHKLFLRQAEELAALCDNSGWGCSITKDQFYWGSNMKVLTNGMVFLIADFLERNSINGVPRFRKYAAMQLNYLLGTNATGYSFVTGVGDFCVNYPHHRPAFADGIEECIPGLVSGGPNSRKEDKFAAALLPEGTPPMKCFSDNTECYSLNENAIYWNSSAVFLTAGLLDK